MAKTKQNQAKLLKFGRQPSQQSFNGKDIASRADPQMKQKLITTNTSLTHVLAMISMGVCRQITNNELIRQRLIVYLSLVLIGGLVNDFTPLITRSFMFKVQKTNVLNQWFVKIGWFWTLALTSPLIAITTAVLADDRRHWEDKDVITGGYPSLRDRWARRARRLMPYLRTRQMFRLVFNTAIWYVSTNFFLYFEDITGSCLYPNDIMYDDNENASKTVCLKSGNKWIPGFDISGHTFLLIFSNLILIEESAVMIGWEPFGHQLFAENANHEREQKLIPRGEQFRLYNKHSASVRLLFIAMTILSLIWDFMLLQTSLFYHSMLQKLVAAVWAVTAWALTYRYAYRRFDIDVKPPKLSRSL